jgi:aryl-alcohol dehydrogenase-like predicted oxidoreductase
MYYTRLGDTGLVVSRLCFGTMTFGLAQEGAQRRIAKVDLGTAKTLVDTALEAGINFFDTADAYGGRQSEVMLGQALGTRRKDVVIATKVGFRHTDVLTNTGLSRRYIMQSAEDSLQRLNTDYIDVYIVHRVDPSTPLEETLETLNDLVRRGMVRYVGFSNWPAWKAATAVGLQRQHSWAKFIVAQMYYSLLGRDLEHEVVPFVKDAGMGTMIWSPLVGGFLTGKYTPDSLHDDTSRMSDPGNEFIPFSQAHGFQVVEALRNIAEVHSASVAQIALAWLLSKAYVSTIIIGASQLRQLEDNLGSVTIRLGQDEIQSLDDLTAPAAMYPNWFAAQTPDTRLANALKGGDR